ncbi:MAG: Abi family protein [Anaeroplasmataceae bacterium]|nr:Abi family protein [Anaeroplasmataceae bacterium]
MSKKFLTYNQQMKCLRDKNINCNGSPAKTLLCRQGYFNLINGYKTPFTCGKSQNGDNLYINGTSIYHFSLLKNFDEELRYLLLKYLTKAEEEIRTFVSYKFDYINNHGELQWYDISAYDITQDTSNLIGVIAKIYNEINQSHQDYVKFYLEKHKIIPTWIAVKTINFSTFINFLDCSKEEIKKSICELYGLVDSNNKPDYKLIIGSLHWMRLIRNICAHNERVYCVEQKNSRINETKIKDLGSRYSGHRTRKLFDLLVYLTYYLDKNDYAVLVSKLKDLLNELKSNITKPAFDNVRGAIGIKQIDDLDRLLSYCKEKSYNNF